MVNTPTIEQRRPAGAARLPQYIRDGWKKSGPGGCLCPHCGSRVSTNALARAAHKERHRREQVIALARRAEVAA